MALRAGERCVSRERRGTDGLGLTGKERGSSSDPDKGYLKRIWSLNEGTEGRDQSECVWGHDAQKWRDIYMHIMKAS